MPKTAPSPKIFLTAALSLSFGLLLAGCGDDQSPEAARLEQSRAAWEQLAKPKTYSYEIPTSSFTGYSSRTTIQVEGGVVTYRRLESGSQRDAPLAEQWVE